MDTNVYIQTGGTNHTTFNAMNMISPMISPMSLESNKIALPN